MKYKVGDRVKVKNEFDIYEEYRGKQFVIEECDSSDDTYLCHISRSLLRFDRCRGSGCRYTFHNCKRDCDHWQRENRADC